MENEVYQQKLKAIQAYLPMLEKHISRNMEGKKEAPIDVKLKTLHAMIINKDKKLGANTVDNCLAVLIKVFDKKFNPAMTKIKSEPSSSPKSPLTVCSEVRKSPITIPTERKDDSSKSNDLYRRRSPSRYDREFKKEKRSPTRFDRDFKVERLDEYTKGTGGYIKKEPKSSRDYDQKVSKDYEQKHHKSSKDYQDSRSSKDSDYKNTKDYKKSKEKGSSSKEDRKSDKLKKPKSPIAEKSNPIQTAEDLKKSKLSVFDRLGPLKVETKTTLVPVEESQEIIPIDEIEELLNERLEPAASSKKPVNALTIPPLSDSDIKNLLNESPPTTSSHKELDKKELDELKDLQNRIISEIKADKIDLSSILLAKPSTKIDIPEPVAVPAQPERLALKFNPHPRKKPAETVTSDTSISLPPITLPPITFPPQPVPPPVPQPVPPPYVAPVPIKETRSTLITDPRLRSEPISSYKNDPRFTPSPSMGKYGSTDSYPLPYRNTQLLSSFQNEQNNFIPRGNAIEVIGDNTFNRNLPPVYNNRPEQISSNFNRPSYVNDSQYQSIPSVSSLHISNNHAERLSVLNDMVEREKYEKSKKNKSIGEGNNINVPIQKSNTSPTSKFDNTYRNGDYSGTNDVSNFKIPRKRNDDKNAGNSNEKTDEIKIFSEKVKSKDNKSSETEEKDVLKLFEDELKSDDDVQLIEEPFVPPIVIDDDEIDSKVGILKTNPTQKLNESEITKEWLETRLSSLLNPTILGKENLLNMMSKVIDEKKMAEIKKILDGPDVVETESVAGDDDEVDDDDDDDLPIISNKTKKVQPLKSDTENESEQESEAEVATPIKRRGTRSTTAGGKKRIKKKNELQKLNEDIRTMFISEGVLTATGRRMCTIINESHSPEKSDETINHPKKANTPLAELDHETHGSSSTTTTTTKKVVKKKAPTVQSSKKATTPVSETKSDDEEIVVKKKAPVHSSKKSSTNHPAKKATTPLMENDNEPQESSSKNVVKKKAPSSSVTRKATTPLPEEETSTKKVVKKKTPVKTIEPEKTVPVKKNQNKRKPAPRSVVDARAKTPEHPKPIERKSTTITLNKTCQIRLDKIPDSIFSESPKLVESKQQPPVTPAKKQKSDSSDKRAKTKKKRNLAWSSGIIRKAKKKKKVEKEEKVIPKIEIEIPPPIKEEKDESKKKDSNLKAFLQSEEPKPLTSIEIPGLPERRVSTSIADKLNEKFNSVDKNEDDTEEKIDEDTVQIVNVPVGETDSDNPVEPSADNIQTPFSFKSVCKDEIDTQSPLQKRAIARAIAELEAESSLSNDVNVTGVDDDEEWEDIESDSENIEIQNSLPDDIPKTGKDANNFQTLQRLFDNIRSDKIKQQKTANETSPKGVIKLNIQQSPDNSTNIKLVTKATDLKIVSPQPSFRVVNRVQNLGFVKENVGNSYVCCIEKCIYVTKDSEIFFTHLSSHSLSWEGYCHICEAHVLNDEKTPLTTEYRHMMEVHCKLKSPSEDKPATSLQSRGIIKLRRLSGDKLSTAVPTPLLQSPTIISPVVIETVEIVEPEPFVISKAPVIVTSPPPLVQYGLPSSITVRKTTAAQSNNVSILKKFSPQQIAQSFGARKSTTQIPATKPIRVNQKVTPIISYKKQDFNIVSVQTSGKESVQLPKPNDQAMKITSVMGGVQIPSSDSSSNDSIQFTEVTDTNVKVLRPWIKSDSLKYELSAAEMLRTGNRFSLYKCMEKMCTLMTNDRDLFLKHIRKHEQDGEDQLGLNQTSMDMDSWLNCSYCEDVADSCSALVEHIDEEHATSIFQCTHCFYRSSTAYNVVTHHNLHHKNKPTKIQISNGASLMLKAEMNSMIQYRKEYVTPITCEKECGEFFILQEFEDHLSKNHAGPNFNCQFCSAVLTKNLAVKHLVCHSIGLFACIFCHYGTNSIQSIRGHMSNDHSSKLLYVCVRFLRNDVDNPDSSSVDSTVLVHLGETVQKTVFTNYNITTTSKPAISQSGSSSTQATEDTSCCHILSLLELQKAYLDNGGNTEINGELLKALAPPSKSVLRRSNKTTTTNKFEKLVEGLNLSLDIPKKMPQRRQSVFLQELPNSRVMPARRKSVYVPAVKESDEPRIMPKRRKSIYVPASAQEDLVPVEKPVTPVNKARPRQDEIDQVVMEIVKKTGLDGEELYCCCFCSGRSIDHRIFSIHMLKYNALKPEFNCIHCDFKTMRITDLVVHFKIHQRKRFLCYICDEKTSTVEGMNQHFEYCHTKNHKVMPLNPNKTNKETDIFIVTPIVKSEQEIYNYGLNLIEQKRLSLCSDKKIFQPNEFNDLPRVSIFESEVFCAVCSYHTKVRMNMIQHLKRHFESKPVASVDPVNPVPCLNQTEKHFDKMNNLACSSQETITKVQNSNAPKFVVDFRRYICGAKGCVYQTVNAATLKNHLTTLHNKERGYKCPHCTSPMFTTDLVSADRIIAHLKLHETRLCKCSECDFYHHTKASIERHIVEKKHGPGTHCVIIRDEKPVNFKPPPPIDNTPLWIKNQLSNVQKNIRGILVEEEEEDIILHYSDDDETDKVEQPPASSRIAVVKPSQDTLKTNPHVSFICFHCVKSCNTIDELKQHWSQMHKLPKTTSASLTYPGRPFLFKIFKIISCFYCKTFGKFVDIKQHSSRSHPTQSFMCVRVGNNKQCGQCDFLFNTEKELEDHYEKEHFKDNLLTEKDSTFFMDQEFLDQLLKINNSVKYKCEYCDLVIDDKTEMRDHCTEIHPINQVCIKEASNDIQYACSMCKDIFSEEFEAIRHIRSHGPIFTCNYCERTFKSTKMIKQHHEIIHNKSDATYRTQDQTDQIENYLNMKVIFPNGLILLKRDLSKTNFGNFDEIMEKIEHWNQQDKQEKSDLKTALHLHTTLNRNAPGPASKKRLNDSVNYSPSSSSKRMKLSGSSKNTKRNHSSQSSSGEEYFPDKKRQRDVPVEYSFYGQKREPIELNKIYTNMNIGGSFVKVSVDRFAAIFDIDPFISIPKVKDEQ